MKRIFTLTSLVTILLCSVGSKAQIGGLLNMAEKKISEKAAWKKFINSRIISNRVVNGDSLYFLRSDKDAIRGLYATKYLAMATQVEEMENNLEFCRQRVMARESLLDSRSNIQDQTRLFSERYRDLDCNAYLQEAAFYERYIAREKFVRDSTQKALIAKKEAEKRKADSLAIAKREEEAAQAIADSLKIIELCGSMEEWNVQQSLKYKSSHGRQVMLIGTHVYWLNELLSYLAENNMETISHKEPSPGLSKIVVHGELGTLNISTSFDPKTMFTKTVTLTGSHTALAHLFVNYWNGANADWSGNGKLGFVHNVFTDRIYYEMKNGGYIIRVVKNPSIQYDMRQKQK